MAAFVTRLQPMMVAHPSRSSATGAIDNSPGGSYRHWPHTHTGRTSFDHLVGAGEKRRRDGEADRLGDLEVDHQLEFVRSLNREIGGLGALENASNILDAYLAKEVNRVSAIAHQVAAKGPITIRINRRNVVERRFR